MIQRIFELDNAAQQPVIALNNFTGCKALIDTGAMLPMWIKSRKLLEMIGGEYMSSRKTFVTADGRELTNDLYRLTVYLGDIVFANMPILLSPIDSVGLKNVHMVLGATNFRGMVYTIDTISDKLMLDIADDQLVRNVKVLKPDGMIDMIIGQI